MSDWYDDEACGNEQSHPRARGIEMPRAEDIPADFKSWNNKWNRLASTWFFNGLSNANFVPKPEQKESHLDALEGIGFHLGSCLYEHNYKISAIGFLLSQYFDEITLSNPRK
jgi:hypothetical protein